MFTKTRANILNHEKKNSELGNGDGDGARIKRTTV